MDPVCVSVNISPPIKDKFVCEFSDSDHIRHPKDVELREDFVYIGPEVIYIYTQSMFLFLNRPLYFRVAVCLIFKTSPRANHSNENEFENENENESGRAGETHFIISFEWFRTKTRFDIEAKGDSQMAYLILEN